MTCKCTQNRNEPCPLALERIYAIQETKKGVDKDHFSGCVWFINSAEYNYCWFNYYKDLDEPVSDRDISQLLMIPQTQVEEVFQSALAKLKAMKGTDDLEDFRELLLSRIKDKSQDNTTYLPDEFQDTIKSIETESLHAMGGDGNDEDDPNEPAKRGRKKKIIKTLQPMSMPIHRSGKRLDIYGLGNKKIPSKDFRPNKKIKTP